MSFNPMANSEPVEQAFGVPPAPAPSVPAPGMPVSARGIDIAEHGSIAAADVIEALKDVIDPELGINVVDLGLLYGVQIDANDAVHLDMTLTSAACPLTDVIERQAKIVLTSLAADVQINWVWLPPWGPDCITEDGREQLRALGFNV